MGSLIKSKSSSTNSLSPQAIELFDNYVKPYAEQSSKFATGALGYSSDLLNNNNYGTQSVDYGGYDANAQGQIANAQTLAGNLANGILPASYQQNMQDAIQSGVQNTFGNAVNSLGARGVMNSSVTNKANADIANAASNTMAQQYQQNVGQLSNLASQQASLATAPITASSMAQQAALSPVSSLLGLSGNAETTGVNNPLAALSGTGTQTKTSTPSALDTALTIGKFFA